MEELRPFRPVSPGEILLDELHARGWTQVEFAEILGRPLQAINEILSAKKSITPETALLIGQALGTSPEMWMRLETDYRIHKLANEQGEDDLVSRKGKLYSLAPVRELISLRWINCRRTKGRLSTSAIDELEQALCDFFKVNTVAQIESASVTAHLRRSAIETPAETSIRAWVQKVKIEAISDLEKQSKPAKFDISALQSKIPELIKLSATSGKVVPKVKEFLRSIGVTFITLKHLSKTRLDGAAFWLQEEKPVIGITHRINRVDNFWFTLLHECAHLILHGKNHDSFFDEDITAEKQDSKEIEADKQAQDWLIASDVLKRWLDERNGYFTVNTIRKFAEEQTIHPAIVAGRLQHDGILPYTHMRNLLEKVD